MNDPAVLPAGFLAAPVSTRDAGAPLRLCAVIRRPAGTDPAALVGLGEEPAASRFLGCVVDAGGRVHEWLEWEVQTTDFPVASGSPVLLNNALLDAEWTRHSLALRELTPGHCLQTGWEASHPAPMILDAAGGEPVAVPGWELCRDEAALTAAGLPTYSGSLHRYIWNGAKAPPRFLAASPGTPSPEEPADSPGSVSAALPAGMSFNPAAGLLRTQTFLPLSLAAFSDALGGTPWPGLPQAVGPVPLGRAYESLRHMEEPEFSGTHLFSARRGRAGRLAEVFHLKLHLLLGAARAVRALVSTTRLPLLDLSSESFRVTLEEPATGLPFLWTARPVLVRPGTAMALAVPTTGAALRYFLPPPGGPTRYRPAEFGRVASGRGTVRLRSVRAAPGEPVEVEGTLVAEEGLPETVSDLLRLRLRLGDGTRVELFGHLDTKEGLAAGEARFRTVPQRLPTPVVTALGAAGGTTLSGVSFETLPLLGSPCDLYSLGVLAVRVLLVNEANTLAVALDEMLSLTRQSGGGNATLPLHGRLEALAGADPRWSQNLGPQRLLRAGTSSDALPAGLWWEALAVVARCFAGVGADSPCRDLGDFPAGAPEVVFDRLIHDLEALTLRTRSLVVIDWQQNREIRAAIRRVASGGV